MTTQTDQKELDACKRWINNDFDNIPNQLITRAYRDNPEDLQLLAGGRLVCANCGADKEDHDDEQCDDPEYSNEPPYDWPAMWGTLFHPATSFDEDWIRENLDAVAECGILVYDADETGILLAIDGAGYDFYEAHWLPLYRARGLNWHK